MSTFTNLNMEIVVKVCRRFQTHLEAVVEATRDFFELECSPMARETWVQSQVESYQTL